MISYSIIQKSKLEGTLRLDAEYYQPEYLKLIKDLTNIENQLFKNLSGDIICGPFGSAILQGDYIEKGIPLIRVADLNNWFIRNDKLVFIDKDLSSKMNRYQVSDGDLVVSQRGTIAMFSMVTNEFPFWNISANLISIKKSNNIDFHYLLAFLNSKYGINQLYRKLSGQVQSKITTDDIKEILVFTPDKKEQKKIADLIQGSFVESKKSENLYRQAEDILLNELGLKDFQSEENLSYIVGFSNTESVNRLDAEYFQPKYKEIKSKIRNFEFKELDDIVSIKKGVEPGSEVYQEEGVPFIRVSNISKFGIKDNNQQYLSQEDYNKFKENFEPKVGEILLTKDATPGITYYLDSGLEGIISGGILRLKPKMEIEPEYLTLVINSIIGQIQVEQDTGGSIIIHWRPEQIKDVLIPILSRSTQQKIADLVRQSHVARKKAKQLLEEAKQKVEDLIEEG